MLEPGAAAQKCHLSPSSLFVTAGSPPHQLYLFACGKVKAAQNNLQVLTLTFGTKDKECRVSCKVD